MKKAVLVRRRKLGRTSCKAIAGLSETGIISRRNNPGNIPEAETYIRWGCTSDIPGNNVVNTARAIHEVNNKSQFRMKLAEAGLSPPSAMTLQAAENLGYPLVVRPAEHSRGRRLYVANHRQELMDALTSCGQGCYASSLFEKEKEFRVFVVQGRAIAVAEKTPDNPDAVAWNVARGGRFDNVRWDNWPLKAVRVAIEAFNLSSLDFGGVDVMTKEREAYVIEINSAPSLTSPYRQECMTKALDYIVTNGKERIPLQEERGGYRKFIHPAVCENART